MTGLETQDCVIIEEDEVVLPASNPPKLEIDKSVRSRYPSTCTEDPKAPLPRKVAEADLLVPNKVPERPAATVITAAAAHSCDLRVAAREEQHGKPQAHHTTSYPSCSPCNVGCMGFKKQGPGAKGLWPLLTHSGRITKLWPLCHGLKKRNPEAVGLLNPKPPYLQHLPCWQELFRIHQVQVKMPESLMAKSCSGSTKFKSKCLRVWWPLVLRHSNTMQPWPPGHTRRTQRSIQLHHLPQHPHRRRVVLAKLPCPRVKGLSVVPCPHWWKITPGANLNWLRGPTNVALGKEQSTAGGKPPDLAGLFSSRRQPSIHLPLLWSHTEVYYGAWAQWRPYRTLHRYWISTDKIPNIHYNEIPWQIVTTDIWRNYYTIDKDKTGKTDGIKNISQQGCIIKKAE